MPTPFVSYAPNREDVVLWRALGHVEAGRYVDIGVGSPSQASPTFALHERGWRGVCAASSTADADELIRTRPQDTVIVADAGPGAVRTLLERAGATPGERPVHVLRVNVVEVAPQTLESLDLLELKPWVLVLAAATENAEVLNEWLSRAGAAGYQLRLFDGVSRFFAAPEQVEVLGEALSYPACTRDDFVSAWDQEADARIHELERVNAEQARTMDELTRQLVRWRGEVLEQWLDACTSSPQASAEVEAMRATLSWRVTRPLRAIRSAVGNRK